MAPSLSSLAGDTPTLFKSGFDEPEAPAPPARRSNLYAGDCRLCGSRVEAKAGYLGARENGRWTVEHTECPAPSTDSTPGIEKAPEIVLQTGTYTVTDDDGYHTFRVRIQDLDEDFAPGETLIEYLCGPDNDSAYKTFGFIKTGPRLAVWKRYRDNEVLVRRAQALVSDPEAHLEAKSCVRCGNTLTTPESIELGIGPHCRKVWGL